MKNTRKTPSSGTPGGVPSTQQERAAMRRKRRIRRRILRTALVLTVLLVLALLVALLVLHISGKAAQKKGETASFLAVKSIEVEGETRYPAEEIIRASHLYVGESLLVVNKVQAHNAILKQFPYLDYVDVGNASFSTIVIRVRETTVMGTVKTAQGWYVLGANNHALELVAPQDVAADTVRIIGAGTVNETVGEPLLDDRGLRVTRTLLDAASDCGLEGITCIDLTEKTNIRLLWKDQIDVQLGNESNLDAQVRVLQKFLPTILGNNGQSATGRLDMSSYADDDSGNDRAIFSPMDITPYGLPEEPVEESTEEPTDSTEATESTEATNAPAA